MSDSYYYNSELEKLDTRSIRPLTVVIRDGEGNATKYLSLNEHSVPVIIEFLSKLLEK
jgi:hypothetical protein